MNIRSIAAPFQLDSMARAKWFFRRWSLTDIVHSSNCQGCCFIHSLFFACAYSASVISVNYEFLCQPRANECVNMWLWAISFGFWLVKIVLFRTNEAIKWIISSRVSTLCVAAIAVNYIESFQIDHGEFLKIQMFKRQVESFLLYRCSPNKVLEIGLLSKAHLRKQLR